MTTSLNRGILMVGAVLVPVWAAIGAIAAIVSDATVVIEKREKADDEDDD